MASSYSNNAHSLDGLEFFFESKLTSPLTIGDFVVLRKVSGNIEKKYLGVIEIAEIVSERLPRSITKSAQGLPDSISSSVIRSEGIKGSGRVLGRIDAEEFREISRSDSFNHFKITEANEDDIKKWSTYQVQENPFSIGKFLNSENILVPLVLKDLSRHTFLSGQTGSGKSTAIRTAIKKVLQEKEKPKIIIFDLNSEYNDLCNKSKDDVGYKSINLSTKVIDKDVDEFINIDFFQMDDEWKLSIINIDPIEDPVPFHKFCRTLHPYLDYIRQIGAEAKIKDQILNCQSFKNEELNSLGYAFDNIDLSKWDIWKSENTKILLDEVIDGDNELINIDLGSIKTKIQKLAVASFILELLWKNRETKQEFLIVIDEAHNIIPRVESNLLSKNIINRMIDIAGEGRKYGLYLFLCSQQPSKIHENVLSLCNNLILLQTTSTMDLEYVYSKFSSIPKSFIDKARFLKQGEAIIGGPLVKTPVFMKIDHLKGKD